MYLQQRLNCWQWPENLDSNNLKPSGYMMTNPDEENAPFIEIVMLEYNAMVQYPAQAEVKLVIHFLFCFVGLLLEKNILRAGFNSF